MNHTLLILPRADRNLKSLPERDYERVDAAILSLADNPRPQGCKKLKDREAYRIRVGVYRVIYKIDDAQRIILVVEVLHRREAYR